MDLHFNKCGSGSPVLILHGLFGSSDNWKSVADSLSADHEVFCIDLRNHGRSFHSDEFSYDDMVDDLRAFVRSHNRDRVSIVGHSMGGKAAMKFAFRYPDLVHKLVVVDIAPKQYPTLHESVLKGLSAVPLDDITLRRDADEVLSGYISNIGVRQFLMKNLYQDESDKWLWRFNLDSIIANMNRICEATTNGSFDGEALLIRGEKSGYVQDSDLSLLDLLLPEAEIVTIPDAGHWPHAEQPALFIENVNRFLL